MAWAPEVLDLDALRRIQGRDDLHNTAYDEPHPRIHPELTYGSTTMAPAIEQVADNVYNARGFDPANTTFVEGDDGVIVIDAMTAVENAPPTSMSAASHRTRGYEQHNATWRNWYLSCAAELGGDLPLELELQGSGIRLGLPLADVFVSLKVRLAAERVHYVDEKLGVVVVGVEDGAAAALGRFDHYFDEPPSMFKVYVALQSNTDELPRPQPEA